MKIQSINNKIRSKGTISESYEMKTEAKANTRSLSLHYCKIMNLLPLSELNINKILN